MKKLEQSSDNHLLIDFDQIANIAQHGLQTRELEAVYNTAIKLMPNTILEIGAGSGVSSILLASVAKQVGGRLFTVEKQIHRPNWQNWFFNLNSFNLMDYVTLISANSPYIDWANLPFDEINYLLIDGNHNAIAVLTDFFIWSSYIPIGGRIAFHDCVYNSKISIGIEMILETMPYKDILHIDIKPGIWIIEKTHKTHGHKSSASKEWQDCIKNRNQYNIIIEFDTQLTENDIDHILSEFPSIPGESSNIADISDDKKRTLNRKHKFSYLEQFAMTISIIIGQDKCVVVFSISDSYDKVVNIIIDSIQKVIRYKVDYIVVSMDVISTNDPPN